MKTLAVILIVGGGIMQLVAIVGLLWVNRKK